LCVSCDAESTLHVLDTLYAGNAFFIKVVLDVLGLDDLLLEARVLRLLSLLRLVDHIF